MSCTNVLPSLGFVSAIEVLKANSTLSTSGLTIECVKILQPLSIADCIES